MGKRNIKLSLQNAPARKKQRINDGAAALGFSEDDPSTLTTEEGHDTNNNNNNSTKQGQKQRIEYMESGRMGGGDVERGSRKKDEDDKEEESPVIVPMAEQNSWRPRKETEDEKGMNAEEKDQIRYEEHLSQCADDTGGGGTIPVEQFGQAILRGMGWAPGKPIGRNQSRVVEPVVVESRPGRLGLGANPADISPPRSPSSRRKSMTKLRENSRVQIRHGKYTGRKGVVIEFEEGIFTVEHEKGSRTTYHTADDLEVLIPGEESNGKGENAPSSSSSSSSRNSRKHGNGKEHSDGRYDGIEEDLPTGWAMQGIRVRIISKRYAKGKWYRKKGSISRVRNTGCVVNMDSGHTLEDIPEHIMETVVPREGSKVIILTGKNRGITAKIRDRNSRKERVVVETRKSRDRLKLYFDDVAEIA